MSNRQQALTLQAEFDKVCTAFAAKHGLILSSKPKTTYYPGDFRVKFATEFCEPVEGQEDAKLAPHTARDIAQGLFTADVMAYPAGAKEVLEQLALTGRLFKFGDLFGPITGWNRRARTSPMQFMAVTKNGFPCMPMPYKTRGLRADSIGVPADIELSLDLQIGDPCFIEYTPEVEGDPDDQPGFYPGRIVSTGKASAQVTYDGNEEAGTDDVPYGRLIVRPRFI